VFRTSGCFYWFTWIFGRIKLRNLSVVCFAWNCIANKCFIFPFKINWTMPANEMTCCLNLAYLMVYFMYLKLAWYNWTFAGICSCFSRNIQLIAAILFLFLPYRHVLNFWMVRCSNLGQESGRSQQLLEYVSYASFLLSADVLVDELMSTWKKKMLDVLKVILQISIIHLWMMLCILKLSWNRSTYTTISSARRCTLSTPCLIWIAYHFSSIFNNLYNCFLRSSNWYLL
jgi:hypothetical protein